GPLRAGCGARGGGAGGGRAGPGVGWREKPGGGEGGEERRQKRGGGGGGDTDPPLPQMIADRISIGGVPTAASAVPAATMTRETWFMRRAPWRTMKLPHPSCATREAAAVKPK